MDALDTCWFTPLLLDELADHIEHTHRGIMNETERITLLAIQRQIGALLGVETFTATTQPASEWRCPIHHTQRIVPAGVSKKTGKAYDAFVVCAEQGCDEKPPRVNGAQPQQAQPGVMP